MGKFDIDISCECGSFSGLIKQSKGATGNHLICACADCKSFLFWLKKNKSLYSVHGGAELYQTSPSSFQITQGKEHLKCLHLSPKGLDRWFVSCCNTPIANCLGANQNFIGFFAQTFKFETELDKKEKIGEIKAICNAEKTNPKAEIPVYKKFPFAVGVKVLKLLLSGKLNPKLCQSPLYKNKEAVGDTILIDLEDRKHILQNI